MQNVKRALQWAAWMGLALVLVACGNGGKGIPPEEKSVVIGTPAHIKAKRESTHRLKKALPIGVTHQRFKDGKLLADDAPHPYTLSSGTVLVSGRNNALVRVAYHEDTAGTLSAVIPSSFIVSDPSIVSAAVVDRQHPNAALLTTTGKKGNSYITALDAQGNAISKFMVLAAEVQKDVLVVSDPDIHPILCSSRIEPRFNTVCDYNTSTNFDLGQSGFAFSMDAYLKDGTPAKKYVLFDDASLAKLKALNAYGSVTFNKKAIYFERIDTLLVMDPGGAKVDRMAVIGRNPADPSDSDPNNPSLWFNALAIHHVATQDEFNTYVDFGGTLSSSRLRDEGQVDELVHEIAPGSSVKATLVGVVFKDGTELGTSEDRIAYTLASSRYPVDGYKYELRQKGDRVGVGKPECYVKAHMGVLPKFSLNSFKTQASSAFGGSFSWNGGKPDFELGVKPLVDVGGQISLELVGGGSIACSIELAEFLISEIGVPLFGNVKIVLPLEAKSEFFADATGQLVIVSPHFSLGSAEDTSKAGSVGLKYSLEGGPRPDFSMKATLPKRHLGFAEGSQVSKVSGSLQEASAEFKAGYRVGVGLGLVMRAEVGSWFGKLHIDAEFMDALIGVESTAGYVIDSARKKYRKFKAEAEGGIGLFATFQPTITVTADKLKWLHVSFSLFNLGSQPLYFSKFPSEESEETDLEPRESLLEDHLKECYVTNTLACREQKSTSAYKVEIVNSTEQIVMDDRSTSRLGVVNYRYHYVFRDKDSGRLITRDVPMTAIAPKDGDLRLRALKYGATDILAEAITSNVHGYGGGNSPFCLFWTQGDDAYSKDFKCPSP